MKLITMTNKELYILLLLTILAAVPRLLFLDTIPSGIHGDEGWTGIDARYILEHGFISPYTGNALGQPTGPLYITALSFLLFGDSILSLRLSMTFFAILTIPLFYIFLRYFFNPKISTLTTILFAFSLMHIHYSRIAFMLITAPIFEILTLIFLYNAHKKRRPISYILAGIFAGIGLHTYNSFLIFPIIIALILGVECIFSSKRDRAIQGLLFFLIFLLVTASPLIYMMIQNPEYYFSHHATYSILHHPEFLAITAFTDKVIFIISHGLDKIIKFFTGNFVDYVDGFGKYHTFGILTVILGVLGIISIIYKKKLFPMYIASIAIIILLTSFLTFEGVYRRQILFLVPFFFCIGYFISFVENHLRKAQWRKITMALISVLVVYQSSANINTYFFKFAQDLDMKYIFTHELTDSFLLVKQNYNNESIYLFSSRWNCYYETPRYILHSYSCIDAATNVPKAEYKFPSNSYVILLNEYISLFPAIQRLNISGKTYIVKDPDNGNTIGIIYKTL